MEVWLLVIADCPSCREAEGIWRAAVGERAVGFQVVDAETDPEGRRLAEALRLQTFPAIVIDGHLKAVGVQSRAQALALLEEGPK